jgi:hypothetical protein
LHEILPPLIPILFSSQVHPPGSGTLLATGRRWTPVWQPDCLRPADCPEAPATPRLARASGAAHRSKGSGSDGAEEARHRERGGGADSHVGAGLLLAMAAARASGEATVRVTCHRDNHLIAFLKKEMWEVSQPSDCIHDPSHLASAPAVAVDAPVIFFRVH